MGQGEVMWHLYVVECSDDSLYTGISTDVDARIRKHNSGKGAKYTRSRRPVKLIMSWPIGDRSAAAQAESAFKKCTRAQKLQLLSEGRWCDCED